MKAYFKKKSPNWKAWTALSAKFVCSQKFLKVSVPENGVKTQIQFGILWLPQAVQGHVAARIGDPIIPWCLTFWSDRKLLIFLLDQ